MTNWVDVCGINRYSVSDDGIVKNNKTGRILKQGIDKDGYKIVVLSVMGNRINKRVHRIVAEAFLQNPNNKPQVNHLDENKRNNSVSNLEWVTSKENNNYGNHNSKMIASKSKAIIVIYNDNTFEEYPSATVFSKESGLSRPHIVQVLKGQRKTTGGLRFCYADEFSEKAVKGAGL